MYLAELSSSNAKGHHYGGQSEVVEEQAPMLHSNNERKVDRARLAHKLSPGKWKMPAMQAQKPCESEAKQLMFCGHS